jgi:hypothetical protein
MLRSLLVWVCALGWGGRVAGEEAVIGDIFARGCDAAPTCQPADFRSCDACAQPVVWPGCDQTCGPTWNATAGAVFLHRSTARPALLVENGQTGAELANVSDFDPGFAVGPRLTLARRMGSCWQLEGVYFQVDGWTVTRGLASTGNLRVPLVSNSPLDYFDTASATYSSLLNNAEVNLKYLGCDWLRLGAGFRRIELHERLRAGADSPDLWGNIQARTTNHLYGFQLTTDAQLWNRGGPFSVEGFLKAGVFGTHVGMHFVGEGTFYSAEGHDSLMRTSLVGEVGLTARYRFGSHCSVFAGYEAMWLEGVGLAGNIVAAMNVGSIEPFRNGTAFYHGALVGGEFTW